MLDFMRKHAQSWMIKVALGAIAVVFIFWGIWSPDEGRDRDLAKIGDQVISIAEARNYYQSLRENYQSVYRDKFNDEMAKKLGLKERALKDLINKALLIQEARRLHLTVSPEELQAVIQNYPAFQQDGVFSKANYERALQQARINPKDFETSQGQGILISKVQTLIVSAAKISDREVLEAYRATFEKVNLDFLAISSEAQQVSLTPEEAAAYFAKHRDDFKIPARVKIRYLTFNPAEFTGQVQVKQTEIEKYYQDNQDKFGQPKQVKVRHILIRADAKDKDTSALAKKKAETIREEASKGKDFAKLAKEYSEDPGTKNQGGDLGYISRGMVVPEFETAAFSLKTGEISNVVQTPYGFHILKVEEIKEAKIEPMEKVKDKIQADLKTRKARDVALDEADQAYAAATKEKQFDNFAREKKLTIKEAGPFAAADKNDLDPKLKDAAVVLSKGEISPVLRVGDGFALLQVVEKQEPRVPELKEVEAAVSEALRREKQKEKAQAKAVEILEKLKKGADLKVLASQEGLRVEETGFFERAGNPPKMEGSEDLRKAISAINSKNPYPEKPVFINGKYSILRLREKKEVDQEQFKSQMENFRKALIMQKQETILTSWLDDLLEQAKAQGKFQMIKELNDTI